MIKYPDLYSYYSKFTDIPVDDWLKLETHSQLIELAPGEAVFSAGENTPNALTIRKGIVRNYYTTLEGKEYIKIFLTDGQMVSPYIENITGIKPRSTAVAITRVEGISIPFNTLLSILDSTPALARLHLRLIQMFYIVKERREYELLTLDATQRYEGFMQEYAGYAEQIPQKYIASYLGITPVSLSRLRQNLR
jgi:CRP-like cAMP-binding protein